MKKGAKIPSSSISLEKIDFPAISDMRKRAMLSALQSQLGIVSAAARVCSVNRDTHWDWLKEDPQYAKAVKRIGESAIDFAEGKLFELMKGVTIQQPNRIPGQPPIIYTVPPNVAACIFYLKTKGKARGYIERLQLEDITDEDDLNTTLDV